MGRRKRDESRWEWLVSAALGAALAGMGILWWGRGTSPKPAAVPVPQQETERSVGFEVTFGFRVLLPEPRESG